MSGATIGKTSNYNLNLIRFDATQFQDLEHNNWRIVDAVLFAVTGLAGITGVWANSTAYVVTNRVIDGVTGTIFQCAVGHTSAASGSFSADRAAHPTYWTPVTVQVNNRGVWQTATSYLTNDFITFGNQFGMALSNFTSGASFAADVAALKIIVLIDLTTNMAQTAADAAAAAASATAAALSVTQAQTSGALSIPYVFSTTTTDADPGAGNLRLNQGTQNTATVIRADLTDALARDWTTVLGTLANSTNAIKGYISLFKRTDPTKFMIFSVSALASPAGYKNITVANVASSSASPFSNGDPIAMVFDRVGDQGASGPGTGDVISTNNLSDLTNKPQALINLGGTTDGIAVFKAANNAAIRVLLALTIGTDVQAYDTILQNISGLTTAAGGMMYFTGVDAPAMLAIGASGKQMESNGTAPIWADKAGIVPKRQTVLHGPKAAGTGLPTFLPATNGSLGITMQNVDGTHPFVFTIGKGYGAVGEVNYVKQLTAAAAAWTGFKASVHNYLWIDDASTPAVGSNWVKPQYSFSGDPTDYPASLLHLNNNLTDDYGNTWTAVGAPTYTATSKFGSHALTLVAASSQYIWSAVPPNWDELDQWTIEFWFKRATTGTNQELVSLGNTFGLDVRYATTNKIAFYLSSNGTSWNVANASAGVNALTDTASFHHFALTFDGASYKVYIDGVQEVNVASALKITPPEVLQIGVASNLTLYWNGVIDEIRMSSFARYTAGFTPSASAFTVDEPWDVFDIQKNQMFTWPTQAAVNRVYVAEVLCDGTTVTDAKCYAYKGEFTAQPQAIPASGTAQVITHNLGVDGQVKLDVINQVADAGYTPKDRISLTNSGVAGGQTVSHTDYVVSWNQGSINVMNKSTGALITLTSAKWLAEMSIKRMW